MSRTNTILLLAFSLVFIISDYFKLFPFIRDFAESKAVIPIKSTVSAVEKSLILAPALMLNYARNADRFKDFDQILDENLRLKDDLIRKDSEIEILKSQLGTNLPSGYRYIIGKVIDFSLDEMEVAVGEKVGVKEGMTAVFEDQLIGRVTKVSPQRSVISLVSDPLLSVPVKTTANARGETKGKGLGESLVTKVLKEEPLFIDDMLYTTGALDWPEGLSVGRVTYIQNDDKSPYKEGKIENMVKPYLSDSVFIISEM